MLPKPLALLLLAAASVPAQTPPPPEVVAQVPGGLKGEIVMLAKNRNILSVAVKLTNESTRGDAFVLLFGEPDAFDDVGNHYEEHSVTGVAFCPGPQTNPPSYRLCVGVPNVDQRKLFPLQSYTVIEKGKSVVLQYQFNGNMGTVGKGERFSITHEIAYRFGDFDTDNGLSDQQKLKALHFGSLSWNGVRPLTPDVKSSITFDKVK